MPRLRSIFMIPLAVLLVAVVCGAKRIDLKDPPNAPAAEHAVSIKGMKFTPATLTIPAGHTVVWTNSDDHDHTVVADDGSFKSGNIGNGESFRQTFHKKGRFKYSCTYHPRMKGLIVVSD